MKPLTKQVAFLCVTVVMVVCLFCDQTAMAGTALGGMLALIDPGGLSK